MFAKRRTTWSRHEAEPPSPVVPFDRLESAPSAGRPPWVSRYEMRTIAGGMPSEWDGSEASSSTSCLWVRDDPPRPLDYASLAALCDTFMPRICGGRPNIDHWFRVSNDQGRKAALGAAVCGQV